MNKPGKLASRKDWDLQWAEIFDHYQNDLRHAYYIHAFRNDNENHLLEIAAGSFRDMALLNQFSILCEGIDFSLESVERAKVQFPKLVDYIHQMDAFNLSFLEKHFDMSYHNGLLGYFEDQKILSLLHEQARVTKYRIIATVHNAHNKSFKEYFDKKAETDSLYNIRFFHENEMRQLMSTTCSKVTIVPVGKGKKYHEDELISMGITDPKTMRSIFDNSGTKYINESERLFCIGDLYV